MKRSFTFTVFIYSIYSIQIPNLIYNNNPSLIFQANPVLSADAADVSGALSSERQGDFGFGKQALLFIHEMQQNCLPFI